MCLEANWQIPDAGAGAEAELDGMPSFVQDGLRYAPAHAFWARSGVPGVVYGIRRDEDGEAIGSAVLLVSRDPAAVMHAGHIGCAIHPAHRKQGHTTRLIRALAPVLRARGVEDIVLACDVGHASQYESCALAGAVLVGEEFADASGQCGARFLLRASDGALAG